MFATAPTPCCSHSLARRSLASPSPRRVELPSRRTSAVVRAGTGTRTQQTAASRLAVGASVVLGGLAAASQPALAAELALRAEPSNALSLPTWAIHVSSVAEWIAAMGLVYRFAEVSGNPAFKGLTWGMLPSLGGAMCACTWHLFYNSPELEFLVSLQAFLTLVGNFTCWAAAYRIYVAATSDDDGGKGEQQQQA